jgi:uncharacterized protein (UPF0276 family)
MSAALAFTYGGRDAALLQRVLPFVGHIEITPDIFARRGPNGPSLDADVLAELRELQHEKSIIVHGVGLSIGSYDGMSEDYLRLLDQLFEHVDVAWHSEHLGYTRVGDEFLGTMLTLPRKQETLDMVAERVTRITQRYPLPFLLENVAALLPDPDGDVSPAHFLSTLGARTGCGLLLDVYNLECDAHNFGLDIEVFLGELDLARVTEIHVACGMEHRGYLLDVHSRRLRKSTVVLLERVLARCANVRAVTYEIMPEAVPVVGIDMIVSELEQLARVVA